MEVFHAEGAESAPAFPLADESEAFSRPNLAFLYMFGEDVKEGETLEEYTERRQSEYEEMLASRTPEEQSQIDNEIKQAELDSNDF